MPFLGGPPLHPMTPEIVAAFLAGFAAGLIMDWAVIPAMVDTWAGSQRSSWSHRRHRDR